MTWKREGSGLNTKMVQYDANGNKTGKEYRLNIAPGTAYFGNIPGKTRSSLGDGYKTNNWFGLAKGNTKQVQDLIQATMQSGKELTRAEYNAFAKENGLNTIGEGAWNNVSHDLKVWLGNNGIDLETYNFETGEAYTEEELAAMRPENEYNPYEAYLEEQRARQESAELGLLNETTRANIQNAEISAQQAMIQQAQFKDQLVEQIKTDRLSKMRAGLTPMQIAQEDLQFMVGNMQGNNQNMQMVNQQRLAAQQQQAINPYQAYINANAAITGGQGYGNVASGFAATDAGDLYQQALRIAKSKGRIAPSDDDFLMAQGQKQ